MRIPSFILLGLLTISALASCTTKSKAGLLSKLARRVVAPMKTLHKSSSRVSVECPAKYLGTELISANGRVNTADLVKNSKITVVLIGTPSDFDTAYANNREFSGMWQNVTVVYFGADYPEILDIEDHPGILDIEDYPENNIFKILEYKELGLLRGGVMARSIYAAGATLVREPESFIYYILISPNGGIIPVPEKLQEEALRDVVAQLWDTVPQPVPDC